MPVERELGSISVALVQHGFEIRVRQDSDTPVCRRCKDLLAAPTEGELIRRHCLLMRGEWRGLCWRQYVDDVLLIGVSGSENDAGVLAGRGIAQRDTYLVSYQERLPIRRPHQGEGIAQPLDLVEARLGADIPELDHAVTTDAAQLRVLGRVKGDLLNLRRVALELCRELDVRLLWVPYNARQLTSTLLAGQAQTYKLAASCQPSQ